jgi:hypothetical protein
MYSENWAGVQARIFRVWKSQTAAGRGGAGDVGSIGGQADTIKETTSALADCWKAILAG